MCLNDTQHLPPTYAHSVYVLLATPSPGIASQSKEANTIPTPIEVAVQFLRTLPPMKGEYAVLHGMEKASLNGKVVKVIQVDGEKCVIQTLTNGSEAPAEISKLAMVRLAPPKKH